MFTPQEIQEKTFVKAVFGGYDMGSVDEFLEPLTEDYISLYKENAVLKSKMKILVEKLEEYRAQEDSMKKALVAAQKTSDQMIAEAEKKCAQLTSQTESALRTKAAETQQQIAAEEERIERAKQAAQNFIEVIEKDVGRHLDLLNSLKLMNLGPQKKAAAKPYDFEKEKADPAPAAEAASHEDAHEIAAEIEQNLEKVIAQESGEDVDRTTRLPHNTAKFADLKFGKNYDPNRG